MAVHQQHPPRALPTVFTGTAMKSMLIACLLVLAVAAQAKFFGCGEYYGGYYPYAGVRATTAYTGIPATAVVPAAYPVAYGYPSVSTTQYHAQDELGQASFGYAHPGQASSNLLTVSATQKARKSYTADSRGFRVQSNNFPVTPAQIEDTPEEAAAKTEFAIKSAFEFAAAKEAATPAARAKRQFYARTSVPPHDY